MAAAVGFEPTDVGVKFQCLAAWLRRYIISRRLAEVLICASCAEFFLEHQAI